VADPYAGQITVPTLTGSDTCVSFSSGNHTLVPSIATGGTWYGCTGNNPAINISGGTTTFCPGVYLLDGENNQGDAFVISANSIGGTVVSMGTAGNTYNLVTCPNNGINGVTIITTCHPTPCTNGGGFVVGGTGNNQPAVTLAAPTASPQTGIPKEILFYQVASTADTNANKANSTVAGGPGTTLNGVVYTPAKQVTLQGNPTLGSCTEFIAFNFVIGGTPVMSSPSACGVITQSASALVLLE